MQRTGRQQANAAVVMFIVVPVEKLAAKCQRVFVASKTLGEVGPILQRFILAFRERIVIGNVRAAVRFGDSQRSQQMSNLMRCHRRAAVAVNDQLAGLDSLFFDRFLNQLFGQISTLAMGQHPANSAATVNVDDRVKVVIGPFLGPFELGDVPRPHLIGAAGQQLWLLVLGVSQLVATLTDALVFIENPIHRSDAA